MMLIFTQQMLPKISPFEMSEKWGFQYDLKYAKKIESLIIEEFRDEVV